MSASFYDLLKYAHTGIASPDMTAYDKARALAAFGGWKTQALTDVPPLSFKANGKPLISWSMLGNTKQTGTPSPQNIIMPDFCGKLVGSDWVIPITCAGQTTPVYLGQTQTVRKIRKLVLDGTEDWRVASKKFYLYSVTPDYMRSVNDTTYICSHFATFPQTTSADNVPDDRIALGWVAYSQRLYCTYTGVSTTTDFKAYLAAQYAAGTPVTVWYVLARPETAIVNEPLAKIGDYADELNSEDAGVTIPTAKGQNTLTVDTDLQPSEMKITFKS